MVSKDYANNENYGRVPDNKAPGQYNTPRDVRETRKKSQTDDRSAQPEQFTASLRNSTSTDQVFFHPDVDKTNLPQNMVLKDKLKSLNKIN